MGVLKEPDYKRLVSTPDDSIPVILIYGPDAGLVSERFTELLTAYGAGSSGDPFSQIILDAAEIDQESDRIVNEALTISMFGGKRIIGVRAAGSRTIDKQIEAILDLNDSQAVIIVSAGELKKTQTLRSRIESHRKAASIPCYPDEAGGVDRLIDAEIAAAGLRISREARTLLHMVLGANRLGTRQELQKLCLYCAGAEQIETVDVEAIVADAGTLALDKLVDAVAQGKVAHVSLEFDRLTASGMHPTVIALQTMRHVQSLDVAVTERTGGRLPEQAMNGMRPPIFSNQRRDLVKRQISIWTVERIGKAANVLYDAIEQGRKNPGLEHAILSNALLSVARVAGALARRQ